MASFGWPEISILVGVVATIVIVIMVAISVIPRLGNKNINSREEDSPQPSKFETRDQEMLYQILSELQMQRRTTKSINTAVQIIGLIMILSALSSCYLLLFGTAF